MIYSLVNEVVKKILFPTYKILSNKNDCVKLRIEMKLDMNEKFIGKKLQNAHANANYSKSEIMVQRDETSSILSCLRESTKGKLKVYG